MEPIIGIIENNSAKVAQTLNVILADEFLLYTKTKNTYQNLDDNELHRKLIKGQYEQLKTTMDSIAAHIHSTGYNIPVTLEIFSALEQLAEQAPVRTDRLGLIHELLEDHESLIIRLKKKAGYFGNELQDSGVGRYIIQLIEIHERMMLELKVYL